MSTFSGKRAEGGRIPFAEMTVRRMVTVESQDLLQLARGAAQVAAAILLDGQPDAPRSAVVGTATKSSPTDVVTEKDLASEKAIIDYLAAARPQDGFIAEESGTREGESGVKWVIDPLDGTVNYLYGSTQWCVSIAAVDSEGTLVGVVLAPAFGVEFWAVRGEGAWRKDSLGETRLGPVADTDLATALVATGFGYREERRRNQARVVGQVIPQVRDIRRKGSAALDLCWVASGVVNAYYERGTNAWDIAAGGLVAAEAGARVSGLRGNPAGTDMVLAAAPGLHAQLVELLTGLDADLGD